MNDLMIRTLREDLVRLINGVPLPYEVKRLVLKEIYSEVCAKAEESIQLVLSELDKKEKETEQ